MAKSTVDLTLWLDDLTDALTTKQGLKERPYISIEIFSDASFRIMEHKVEGNAEQLCDESCLGNGHRDFTINDLPYLSADSVAEKILEDQSVANVKADEL